MRMRNKKAMKNLTGFFLAAAIFCTAPAALAADFPEEVIPMGNAVGITIGAEGVLIVNIVEVETESGKKSPAYEAGIAPGDIITQINAETISCVDDLKNALEKNNGEELSIRVLRGDKEKQFTLCPCKSTDGVYEMGVWLRDSMTGLGTITFYDPASKTYGALGHPVNDLDTGVLMPIRTGTIMRAAVSGVVKGQPGVPGQLQGAFNLEDVIGNVEKNTESGIFGTMTQDELSAGKNAIPVADASEIELGEAVILSNIAGKNVEEYTVEVTRIYSDFDPQGRNMMIRVTDEDLIAATGGIVQGMSGSPIIQNGKIIGAVTHVLVNNPIKGYAITIENMLQSSYGEVRSTAA